MIKAKPIEIKGETEEAAKARLEQFRKSHLTYFFEPYDWQKRMLAEIRYKNLVAAIASNKIGKSALIINVIISWCLGYEPWTMAVEKGGEDWILVRGYWFRKSSLGIDPPVDILLTGEDWKQHIGGVLVPELLKWAPAGFYQTKKNEQGVEFLWEWNNKSTLTIMCYTQDDALFESFRKQGVVMDEPPPQSKYTAMSRGLLLDQGKLLMSMTPLKGKGAWILDEIVLSGRRDIGIIDHLKITDNPDLYNSDIKVLQVIGLNEAQIGQFFRLLLYDDAEKQTPVKDRGNKAEKFLESLFPDKWESFGKLKILKFIKDIPPDEVPPRVFGQFGSLIGRVLKEFDLNIHRVQDFEVPTNWPVTVMIDFHLSTPQAVSYWAVNPQDIHYCIGETWENISADDIADDITRKIKNHGWRITEAYIDPLSKGDTAYMRNALGTNIRDTFTILTERLDAIDIPLAVASKDKDSGIKNIETWLRGRNGLPTCYIFESCERHFFEVQRWVFDDDKKPVKENDHFMENWYRYTLTGAKFIEEEKENYQTERNNYNPLTYGLRVNL
jgi:hypothetical protein